jgi:4-amino-4-deoxy-L-arabinose transferase-like glycosyltransferase
LVGVTALAAVLRFYRLGEWSFWTDELFTVARIEAEYSTLPATVRRIAEVRWMPLSLVLTSPVLNMLGTHEWAARLVPAIIGVASVPLLYLPTRKIFGPTVALLAALLLAVAPWHIYWSQNARFYTSLMLLSSLALMAFFLAIERDRPLYLLGFIAFLYLAASERLHALFVVPIVVAYLLLVGLGRLEKPMRSKRRTLALLALPALIFAIPVADGLRDVVTIFGGVPNHSPLRLLASIVYQLGIGTVVLALAGGTYFAVQKNRAALFMLLSALLPIILLVVVSPFMFTVDRYVFAVLPFWLVLTALALKELIDRCTGLARLLSIGLLVLVLGIFISEDALYFTFQAGNRPDWRSAYQLVDQRRSETDVVASAWPEVGRYYLNREVVWINGFDPDMPVDQRTWFLIDEAIGGVEPAVHQWILEEGELVDVIVTRMPGKSLDIRIYLLEPAASPRGGRHGADRAP